MTAAVEAGGPPESGVPAPEGTGTQKRRQTSKSDFTSVDDKTGQLTAFLDAMFGTDEGYVHTAVGIDPYLNDNCKYTHKDFKQRAVKWPEGRDETIKAFAGADGAYDIYLAPYLSQSQKREKGFGKRDKAHADYDGHNLDIAEVERLGGFAVESGTRGHAHVHIPLTHAVTPAQHDALCRALGQHLGDSDAKFSDNDLLRPPGTLNYKPTLRDEPAAPVRFLIPPSGKRVNPFELAALLGVDITDTGSAQRGDHDGPQEGEDALDTETEPFDLDSLPGTVKAALEYVSGDRSTDTARLVGASYDSGLTLTQVRYVVQSRTDLAERLAERNDDDVLNCWNKIAKSRETVRQAHDLAPNTFRAVDRTDSGNTDIVAATYSKNLRYCPDISKWFAWDGNRWQVTPDDAHAYLAARTVADNLPQGGLDEKGKPDAAAKHYTRSRNRGGLDAMVALARRNPDLQIPLDTLDTNRYELNTPDGIINLRTGEVSPSNPTKWHTKITGSGHNPDIPPTEFLKFLGTTFDGDQELIDYIQAVAGITAIGEVLEHILPFCFGSGANGKTVLLDILTAVLGDYAIVSPGTFLLAGRDKHETEIARLHGARLVVCSELNADSKFDEAKAKALTGGDKLTGRYMHKNFFDFVPSHTLWLAGNNQPDVPAGGTSFWRRLRLIPFQNTVPEEKRIENLAVKLVDGEGPAIMAWIVAGAVRYLSDGISTPQEVLNETEEYAEATRSGVARFIQEVCKLGTGNTCRADSVYKSYLTWAGANNEPLVTIQKFGLDIKAAGVTGRKTKDGKSYDMTVHTERLPSPQQTKMRW